MALQALKATYLESCTELGVLYRDDLLVGEDGVLRTLVVRGNEPKHFNQRLSNEEMVVIGSTIREAASIEGLIQLESVDLRYNHLGNVFPVTDAVKATQEHKKQKDNTPYQASMKVLSDIVHNASRLVTLNLMGNSIDYGCFEILCQALAGHPSIKNLNLKGNPLGNDSGKLLAHLVLKSRNCIENLDLSDTDQSHDSIIAIAGALTHNTCMKKLSLENPLRDSKEEETMQHIGKMLQVNTTLEDINLSKHGVTDHGAQVLAERLLENRTLRVLHLRANKIGHIGAEAIAALLLNDSCIAELDMTANHIGNFGGKAFAAVIERNSTLRTLKLGQNAIEDYGLACIAAALTLNASLTTILLWGNKFGPQSSTKFLTLSQTRFTYYGVATDIKPYQVDDVIHVAQQDPNTSRE